MTTAFSFSSVIKAVCLAFLCCSLQLGSAQVEVQITTEEEPLFVNYHLLVGGFDDMVGIQGSFEWNPDSIDFVEISKFGLPNINLGNFNLMNVEEGYALFSWLASNPGVGVSIEACDTLFSFRFRKLLGASEFRLANEPVPLEFLNKDFETVGVTSFQVEECVYSNINATFSREQMVSFYPNPVGAGQRLQSKGSLPPHFSVHLSDITGQSVFEFKGYREEGIVLPTGILPGMYFLRIYLDNELIAISPLVVK